MTFGFYVYLCHVTPLICEQHIRNFLIEVMKKCRRMKHESRLLWRRYLLIAILKRIRHGWII